MGPLPTRYTDNVYREYSGTRLRITQGMTWLTRSWQRANLIFIKSFDIFSYDINRTPDSFNIPLKVASAVQLIPISILGVDFILLSFPPIIWSLLSYISCDIPVSCRNVWVFFTQTTQALSLVKHQFLFYHHWIYFYH